MLENISLDFQKYLDAFLSTMFKVFRLPFDFWNKLPPWVHNTTYIVLVILATFFAIITWKYREAWRHRV